jgi:hypothetical protein
MPYGRLDRGQISATTIQAQGPHEYPKWTTKSQTMTTAAQPAPWWLGQSSEKDATMAAMIKWQDAIPIAPPTRMGFLPSLSTYMTAGTGNVSYDLDERVGYVLVAMNMTIPTTPVANKLTEFEDRPSPAKIVGA